MTTALTANICYLVLMPLRIPLPPGKPAPAPAQKDTPYFFDLDIEILSAGDLDLVIEEVPVEVRCQVLDGQVWLAECRYQLADLLDDTAPDRKQAIQAGLKERLQHEAGYSGAFIEEYSVVLLSQVEPGPDEFVDSHADRLARWLRSLNKPLKEAETRDILGSRARYSERDLTVIDWAGALIIAEEEDFEFDLALLKIGKYQLLRYRLLDRTIERSLQQLRQHVSRGRPAWLPSKYKTLHNIVEQRLALVLGFEKTDQSLLLIGDWYSARVYRLIVDQLSLNQWKGIVQSKIDSLVAINDTVYQELAFSWRRALDFIQFVGWLILLVGYFILFFANLG